MENLPDAAAGGIGIRKYRSEDLQEIVSLFYHTVHTVNSADYTKEQLEAWAGDDPDRESWDVALQEHDSIVALMDGRIAGFGDLDSTGYLDRLYVHKDCQGMGVGRKILRVLENHAKSQGNDIVTSHVSITARPFFQLQGYETVKSQLVERRGVLLRNYVMQKKLV